MVLDYYNLREQPFGATPDSRYLFTSESHREALASLLYGIEAGRGFMSLIAKPGMGKTTLLFNCLEPLRNKGRTVFLFQTIVTPLDFLRALLADLGVENLEGDFFQLQAKLNEILLDQARRDECLIIVIDESQNLDEAVLELVRMLSNFETPRKKLMQIVLAGQPQLAQKLASPRLIQLRQRISIVAHLKPFTQDETDRYIEHRLKTAGCTAAFFTAAALRMIWEHSEGIPRNINNLCFNAMSIGCALKRKAIDVDILREVISDLDLEPLTELVPAEPARDLVRITSKPPARQWSPSRWALRLAAAGALLLPSGGSRSGQLNGSVQAKTIPPKTEQAKPIAPAPSGPVPSVAVASPNVPNPVTPPPPVRDASAPHAPMVARSSIRVLPGQTLYQICSHAFPACGGKELYQIRRMNPWLKDPSHIEFGREILIPSPPQLTQLAEQSGEKPITESAR